MTRQVKWAILFTPFEEEDTEYVKEGCGAMWTQDSPVKVFDTYGEAQKECAKSVSYTHLTLPTIYSV